MEKRTSAANIFRKDDFENIPKKRTLSLFIVNDSTKNSINGHDHSNKSYESDSESETETQTQNPDDSSINSKTKNKNPRWQTVHAKEEKRKIIRQKLSELEDILAEDDNDEKKSRFVKSWSEKKRIEIHKIITSKKSLNVKYCQKLIKEIRTKLKKKGTLDADQEESSSELEDNSSSSKSSGSRSGSPESIKTRNKTDKKKSKKKKKKRDRDKDSKMSSDDEDDLEIFDTNPTGRISRPNPRAKSLQEQSEEYNKKYNKKIRVQLSKSVLESKQDIKKHGIFKRKKKSKSQDGESDEENWGKKVDLPNESDNSSSRKVSVDHSHSFCPTVITETKKYSKKEIILDPNGERLRNSSSSSDSSDDGKPSFFNRKSSEDIDTVASKIPELQDDELSIKQKIKSKFSRKNKNKYDDDDENFPKELIKEEKKEKKEQEKKEKEEKKEREKKEKEEKKEREKKEKEEKKEQQTIAKQEKKELKKIEQEEKKEQKKIKKEEKKKKGKLKDDEVTESNATSNGRSSPLPSQPSSNEDLTQIN